MNILLNAIDKAIGSSNEAGTIHIRRLGLKQYGIKRFSAEGDLVSSNTIEDEPVSTEEIVDVLPDNSDVAVFSDETTGTEDIVMTIDGGDLDEEIAEACDSGYQEDTKKFSAEESKRPEDFGITDYEFDKNGFLNVFQDVRLQEKKLTKLPFNFGLVNGDFICRNNKLTSLEGAPKEVGRTFNCSNNQITSLEGAPQKVGQGFYCSSNQLTSLEGAPREIPKNFYCIRNELTSLKGAPKSVGGDFDYSENPIVSHDEAPAKVRGHYVFNGKKW